MCENSICLLSCLVSLINYLIYLSIYMIRYFSFEGNRFDKIFWLTYCGNKYVLGVTKWDGNKFKLIIYSYILPEICSKQAIFRKNFLKSIKLE